MKRFLILLAAIVSAAAVSAQPLQRVAPEKAGLDPAKLAEADRMIAAAVEKREFPGAVFAVVRHGRMAHIKAFGDRQWVPETLKMKENTIFDLASLSKSTSTALCTMILVERGQIRLTDRVKDYIPEFQGWPEGDGDTTDIRIIDLLTHSSGLPAYAPVAQVSKEYGETPEALLQYITTCKRGFAPKSRFRYSCLNFITLQHIIQKVAGEPLKEFARKNIFEKLGMNDTGYCPEGKLRARCAATEQQPDGSVLVGDVHDPLARIFNKGNSGNAGVFSTADDLAVLSAALLAGGEYNGRRIMGPLTVKKMFTVPDEVRPLGRALGWDSYSTYSSNRGDLFSPSTVCHTGYTGTSIVIDPENDVAVILLTNAVHPSDSGRTSRLRSALSNIVAGAITD